ncbi:MAG: protein translocase subunit SecF [Acidimicrobiia bacterium]
MNLWSQLYRGQTRFDFVGPRRRWFMVSAVLLTASLIGVGWRGFNLSVDFRGGTLVDAANPVGASVAEVRRALGRVGLEGSQVQLLSGGEGIRVQTGPLPAGVEATLVESVAEAAGVQPSEVSLDTVGPTWGGQITRQAGRALIFFLAAVSVFITLRFEWKMAATALVALVHDLVLTAGVYALSGLEVAPATVIAVLTILGYSLYDTVVVFDKILENTEELGERVPYSEIVNRSMNQVLMRSINTSLTSLLPVGSLLFVGSFLLGASTLRVFALALFIGIASGTYSSIFVAAPLLAAWKEREARWERLRRRVGRRDEVEWSTAERVDRPEPALARPPAAGAAAPRPPRQRRRKRR